MVMPELGTTSVNCVGSGSDRAASGVMATVAAVLNSFPIPKKSTPCFGVPITPDRAEGRRLPGDKKLVAAVEISRIRATRNGSGGALR